MAGEVVDFNKLVFRLYDFMEYDYEYNIMAHLRSGLQMQTTALPKEKAVKNFTVIRKCFEKTCEGVLKNGFELAMARNDLLSARQCLEYMKTSGIPVINCKVDELSLQLKYKENISHLSFMKIVKPRYSRSVSPRSNVNSDYQCGSNSRCGYVKHASRDREKKSRNCRHVSSPRFPYKYKRKETYHRSRRSTSLCDSRSISPQICRATKRRESLSPRNLREYRYRGRHHSSRSISPCHPDSYYQKGSSYPCRSVSPKYASKSLKNDSKHRSRHCPLDKASCKPMSNKKRSSPCSASEDELPAKRTKSNRPPTVKAALKPKETKMKNFRSKYQHFSESDSESGVEERSYGQRSGCSGSESSRKKQIHRKPTASKNRNYSDSSPSPQLSRNRGKRYVESSSSASSSNYSDNEHHYQVNLRRSLSESEIHVPKSKGLNKTNTKRNLTKTNCKSNNSLTKPNDSHNNSLFLGRLKELEARVLNGTPDPLDGRKKKANSKKSPVVSNITKSSGGTKSKKSPGVAKSKKSPAATKSKKLPTSVNSNKSLAIAKNKKSPAVAKNDKSPATAKSKKSPATAKSKKSPAVAKSVKSPAVAKSEKSPAPINSKKSPAVTNNKKCSAVKNVNLKDAEKTKASPAVPKDKKNPPKKVKKNAQEITNNVKSRTSPKTLNNKNLPSSSKNENKDSINKNENSRTTASKKQPAKKKAVSKVGAQKSKTAKKNNNKTGNIVKNGTNDEEKEEQDNKEEGTKETNVNEDNKSGDEFSSDDDFIFDSEPELGTLSACLNSIKRKQPRALGSATPPMKIFLSPHTSSIMSPASSADSFAGLTVKIDDKNVVKRMAKANKPKEVKNVVDYNPEPLKSTPEGLRKAMKIKEKLTNDDDSEVECSSFMSDDQLGVDETV